MKTNIILLVALMSFMMVSGCGTGGSNDLYTGLEQQAKIVPLLLSEDTDLRLKSIDSQVKGTNLLEKSPTYPSLSDIAYEYRYEFVLNENIHKRALFIPMFYLFTAINMNREEPTVLKPELVTPSGISSADKADVRVEQQQFEGYEGEGTLTVKLTPSLDGPYILGTFVFNNYATSWGTHLNGSIRITGDEQTSGDEPIFLNRVQPELVSDDEPKVIVGPVDPILDHGGFANYLYTYTNFSTKVGDQLTRTYTGTVSVDIFNGDLYSIESNMAYKEVHEGYENSFRDVTRWSINQDIALVTGRIYNEMLGGYTKVAGYRNMEGDFGELTFTGINGGTATVSSEEEVVEIDVDGPGDGRPEYYQTFEVPRFPWNLREPN